MALWWYLAPRARPATSRSAGKSSLSQRGVSAGVVSTTTTATTGTTTVPESVIASGVTIGGVPVGDMTAGEATQAVKTAFARPLRLHALRRRLFVEPASLGAVAQVKPAVARALTVPPGTAVKMRVKVNRPVTERYIASIANVSWLETYSPWLSTSAIRSASPSKASPSRQTASGVSSKSS